MMAVGIACLLAIGYLSETLPIAETSRIIVALLVFGFSAEVFIVVERAKQPPSVEDLPGLRPIMRVILPRFE